MRVLVLEGDTRRDLDGDAGGGVTGRSGVFALGLVIRRGGENLRIASRFSLSCELDGRSSDNDCAGLSALAEVVSLMLNPRNPCRASSRPLAASLGFGR